MGGPASSTTAEIYMQAHESTAISAALHPPKVWERFVDDVYSIIKRTQLENFFHHINNLHQNIKFTMEEEMDIRKALLVKSLRELLIITACLSYSNKRKPQISKRKRSK